MIYISYPQSICRLLSQLSKHKVYVVGGFIRDALLSEVDKTILTGKHKKDVDLVTADPLDIFLPTIQKLSKKYYVVEHYQVVQFTFEDYKVALTRLRYDRICDGRQADVVFVKTLQEDVWRRDFTINALYADPKGMIIDFSGGYQDLCHQKIRFIGDPKMRILEDTLRMLRYVRFCSFFQMPMAPAIVELIMKYRDLLSTLPQDRVRQEMSKIMQLPYGKRNLEILQLNDYHYK